MNKELQNWGLVFCENLLDELEGTLSVYSNLTEEEICATDIEIDNVKLLYDFFKDPTKKGNIKIKKWSLRIFNEQIDNIENFDYMDVSVSTSDRVAVLEHLDCCRQLKRVIMGWKK